MLMNKEVLKGMKILGFMSFWVVNNMDELGNSVR